MPAHFVELNMRRFAAKFVPRLLTDDQKQSLPGSQHGKKAQQVTGNVKSMLICLFDTGRIIHKVFIPPGQIMNEKFYCDVLRQLKKDMRRKWPDKWRKN
jgi:hypothetical protein